ncbi:ribosome biogenesis protein Nop16 [Whalleya microplaca]|nr:ribosome biogenesis protein Nop16 [Whalleya microplaca]
MGRDLQKRKRRSSRPAIRQPSSKSRRLLNPLGNTIVAKNWDKKATTTQNYRRLGLVSRLKAPTGGVEPASRAHKPQTQGQRPTDAFAIDSGSGAVVGEARVERDASGRIVRVLDGNRSSANPLNDPLNALDSDSNSDAEVEEWSGLEDEDGVVGQLLQEANRPTVKKVRGQSAREVEWLQRLVDRHGSDTAAMARDRALNPMQQTEVDIARRIQKWKGKGSSASD